MGSWSIQMEDAKIVIMVPLLDMECVGGPVIDGMRRNLPWGPNNQPKRRSASGEARITPSKAKDAKNSDHS